MNDSIPISVTDAIDGLLAHYGAPPPPITVAAFELVLLENVAYLASPARRREAFTMLASTIGTTPARIVNASAAQLKQATAMGILPELFAAKLRECARIVIDEFGGDLDAVVRGPLPDATRALRRFPGIGVPGAEKILLLTGRHPFLAPDSNALRVLERLGLIPLERAYARSYAAARAVAEALDQTVATMQQAHALLQHHGRTLCKRSSPRCGACPLQRRCPIPSHATTRHGPPE